VNTANTLIEAVQLGNPSHVKVTIEFVTRKATLPVERVRAVSDGIPESGLTALHVASKLYSVCKDKAQADKYNSMINMLLEAGAEPFAECLVGGVKCTPMELAGRNRPPALVAHIQERRAQASGSGRGRDAELVRRAARAGLSTRDFRKLSGGYGFIYAVGGHSSRGDLSEELEGELKGTIYAIADKGSPWRNKKYKAKTA
jgi:hypothetical protein